MNELATKKTIAKMARKEINAEVFHCWKEQEQFCKEVALLKTQVEYLRGCLFGLLPNKDYQDLWQGKPSG